MSASDDMYYDPEDHMPDCDSKEWTTKDGNTIHIFDMTDGHLLNTIAMLERKGLHVPYEMLRERKVRKL